jgi:UDP-GlcNAc:undecaprenyl-phosphate/decaprenyl-phosphate GlcNAc-1-phosphate transferase
LLRLFILSFAVSFAVGYVILRWQHLHAHIAGDYPALAGHKVHAVAVPRIGGISIFAGWLVGLAASSYYEILPAETILIWILCLLPVFLAGLAEDFTKNVRVRARLLASFLSATLAVFFLNAAVSRVDLPAFDALLAVPAIAALFTLVAISGVAHAINIIDGLNGLALSVCMMALLALGYVAFNVHDQEILMMAGLGVGALLGLLLWNYPSGQIFCGDGGAYFLGAYIAMLSVLLVGRNPQVSAWFPMLLVLYPVWETLFSCFRRILLTGQPASSPDRLHLHTLLYERMRYGVGRSSNGWHSRRNSDSSALLVMFAGVNSIPAVLWWSDTRYLIASAVIFVAVYLAGYRWLARLASIKKVAA